MRNLGSKAPLSDSSDAAFRADDLQLPEVSRLTDLPVGQAYSLGYDPGAARAISLSRSGSQCSFAQATTPSS